MALKAYKLCGDDIYNIIQILDVLIRCCDFLNLDEETDNYLRKWKKIKKEDHPLAFPEDNSDNLAGMFDYFDNIIDNYPDEIVRLDPEIVALSQKLVEGVEVYAYYSIIKFLGSGQPKGLRISFQLNSSTSRRLACQILKTRNN